MKIDIEWVKYAQKALNESGIVTDGTYPKAFKGYISSLAASITQIGLIPALINFEGDNKSSRADNNRAYLIAAIRLMLSYQGITENCNYHKLSYYVNKSLVALKLALRIYKHDDNKKIVDSIKDFSPISTIANLKGATIVNKVDIEWVKSAQKALNKSGIVTDGSYPKAFKGYISSLAAAIAQMGLISALKNFENDNEGKSRQADNNRAYLIHAINLIFEEKKINYSSRETLSYFINKALVALKLAIRMYSCDEKNKKTSEISQFFPISTKCRINEKEIKITTYTNDNIKIYNSYPNIGYLFYRDLYRNEDKKCKFVDARDNIPNDKRLTNQDKLKAIYLSQKLKYICDISFDSNLQDFFLSEKNICPFKLKTTYPGLLIGSGITHGINSEGDIKLGFSFDYTSGLPYIPGSSIKGVLRSVFPTQEGDSRVNYLNGILSKELNYSDYFELEKILFVEGSGNNMVIYFDAFISESKNKDGRILGNDYITPHKEALKEPVPIQFLKVLPDVVFQFQFKIPEKIEINNKAFTQGDIKKLFEQILLDLGVGAKTNVGYGHFKKVENSQSNKQ